MTNEEYVQAALRTESLSDEVRARFDNPEYVWAMVLAIRRLMYSVNTVDAFKKFMFYGKWSDAVRDSMTPLPPHEPIEEIDGPSIRLVHAAMGMVTEAGELLEALMGEFVGGRKGPGQELDRVHIIEEIGDVFWYQAIAADVLKTSFEEIQERNIAKLKARYPGKFTEREAVERDLEREREALTNKTLPPAESEVSGG